LPNSDFFVPTAAMYNVCPEGILFEATAWSLTFEIKVTYYTT
jgi:hypothetical protein